MNQYVLLIESNSIYRAEMPPTWNRSFQRKFIYTWKRKLNLASSLRETFSRMSVKFIFFGQITRIVKLFTIIAQWAVENCSFLCMSAYKFVYICKCAWVRLPHKLINCSLILKTRIGMKYHVHNKFLSVEKKRWTLDVSSKLGASSANCPRTQSPNWQFNFNKKKLYRS